MPIMCVVLKWPLISFGQGPDLNQFVAKLEKHDFAKNFDVKTIDQCRGNEYEILVTISNPPNRRVGHLPWLQEGCSQNHQ